MCSQFQQPRSVTRGVPADLVVELEVMLGRNRGSAFVHPSHRAVMVARGRAGDLRAVQAVYGFPRPGAQKQGPLVYNSRLEHQGAAMWARARPCVIPISKFSEGGRRFLAEDGGVLWAAGLWGNSPDGVVAAIMTRPAAPPVSGVHNRQPVLLSLDSWIPYLDGDADPAAAVVPALVDEEPPLTPITGFRL